MKKPIVVLCACLMLALMAFPVVAGDTHLHTMAGILMNLNHFPSDDEKATLAEIVSDSDASASDQVLANVISNFKHKVGTGDRAALTELSANADAAAGARTLADILLNLAHNPSAEDKAKLIAILE